MSRLSTGAMLRHLITRHLTTRRLTTRRLRTDRLRTARHLGALAARPTARLLEALAAHPTARHPVALVDLPVALAGMGITIERPARSTHLLKHAKKPGLAPGFSLTRLPRRAS